MPEPPLSPSQQVERIREILVGRQMQQIEDRLQRLETSLAEGMGSATAEEIAGVRRDLAREAAERARLAEDFLTRLGSLEEARHTPPPAQTDPTLVAQLHEALEYLTVNLTARIDARASEVLEHLDGEVDHLRKEFANDLARVEERKADRQELRHRFSKLAVAATEDPPPATPDMPDEFVP